MNSPLKVLVLGVGGNVSQGIQKALALADTPTRTVAACIDTRSPGLYVAERSYISPFAEDPAFIPWLFGVCADESIDAVLSGTESVLSVLAPRAPELRSQTGAVCVVSDPGVLAIGRDKLLTCRWLESHALPVPGYADAADEAAVRALVDRCGLPLIAKPRHGKGGTGIIEVSDEDVLERVIGDPWLLLQERLGDPTEEFTVGCFCDRDGELYGTIVMRRALHAGTTFTAEVGAFPDVRAVAERIVGQLRPLGPCNLQLRVTERGPVPFEINVRFSGTTPLRARMGFNEVDAALRHFVLGEPVGTLAADASGVALRYWNEIYVPAATLAELGERRCLDDPARHGVRVENWGLEP